MSSSREMFAEMRRLMMPVIALLVGLSAAPESSFAQASGHVRVKILKAGLLVGAGVGKGALDYRGRTYPFRVTGISLGITAGTTVGKLEGWASGIRELTDFAGTYSSVGGGAAMVGGIGGVHLRNDKGVVIVLQGPKAGLEMAANISAIMISFR